MPEFKENKGFQMRSGNKTPFKEMGSSPADLNLAGIFKNIHGKLTGTEGKRFGETKFGQFLRNKIDVGDDQTGIIPDALRGIDKMAGEGLYDAEGTYTGPDNIADNLRDNIITPKNKENKVELNEEQQNAGNLHDFYTAGGGKLPSISERRTIYEEMGGEGNYRGTSQQNAQLLQHLQGK
tara:strand:+ start:2761 stop:3300 length:540 start_codon:yes stop_codon:yes gene_type:complete